MKPSTLLAAVLGICMLGGAVAQDIKPRTLSMGYGLKEESNQGRAARLFASEVDKLSGSKMKVKLGGNSTMGSDVAMQDALIAGKLEMMVGSTATLVPITREMALWDSPFLFSTAKEADYLLDGPIGDKVRGKLKDKGLVGLVYWENGFRNLTNNTRPVTRMEDLDGIKLRVMQNEVFLQSFRTLGANPVPMAFSDLFGAMENRAVDGQENPYNTILSSKFYEVQKYLTVTNHVYSPWIMLVGRKYWDALSPAEQNVLMTAARTSRDFERKDSREEAAKALADLRARGMQINELSFSEASRMRNKLTRVYATIGASVGMELWIETQNELMKLRGKKS